MFRFFGKAKPPPFDEIRDLLFGDAPLSAWAPSGPDFEAARRALDGNDAPGATAALQRVTRRQEVESRHLLQAWHFLRRLGVQPAPEDAKRVLGIVLEVQLSGGLDTLAAYADHSARYINHGGKFVVWETPEPQMNAVIDALLAAGQRIADVIGPSEGPRRGPPPKDHARLNMLTPSGIHFGEAPLPMLAVDPLAGPLVKAGTVLMQALIERAAQKTA